MQFLLYAPSTTRIVTCAVPVLDITLAPQAPTTTVVDFTVSNVPVLDVTLSPFAPATTRTVPAEIPALDITLDPLAPTTTEIVEGLTISEVPALQVTLSPFAPSSLRELISSVPLVTVDLLPQAPTITNLSQQARAPTGGWETRRQRRDPLRDEQERREESRRQRRRDVGLEPVSEPQTPAEASVAAKPRISLPKPSSRTTLNAAERERLIAALEGRLDTSARIRKIVAILIAAA